MKQGAVALILAVGVAACALPFSDRSKEAVALVQQGNSAFDQKPEEAFALYSKALELDPQNADAHHWLGVLLYNKGDKDGAINKYQRAIELQPDFAGTYVNWGLALSDKGDKDGAIAKYQRAIELKPDYAEAYLGWGSALSAKGDKDGAIAKYQRAIELKPDYADAYNNWGNALSAKGDKDGAIAKYQRAIQLKPDLADAYSGWGLALSAKGDQDGAIAKYQRAIQLQPDYAAAYNNWGNALSAKGDKDGAIAKFQRAIQLKPDYATAYNNWGAVLFDKGDKDEAIVKYRKALSLSDEKTTNSSAHALAQSNWARALEQKGQLKEAITKYELALKIDPKYTFAQNNLAAAKSKLAALENIDDSQQLPKDEPRLPQLRATVLAIAQFSKPEDTERGAAWVVKRQGSTLWLVTCAHLFRNGRNEQSQSIQVQFYNPNLPAEKRASRAATVVQLAPSGGLDLAVLKVENAPADIRPLAMGPGSIPLLAPVYTIGHPDILAQAGPWQALSGEVAGRNGNRIGLNMTISQGNSGGPLLHKDTNQVIGIVLQSQGARNIGYAYDLNTVQTQLKQWGIL